VNRKLNPATARLPTQKLLLGTQTISRSSTFVILNVRFRTTAPILWLAEMRQVVEVCSIFKWAQLIPSSLIGSLLLIRGLQQQSLVPSTHLFARGPRFLGPT